MLSTVFKRESWKSADLKTKGCTDRMWLKHDGAPAHFSRQVIEFLNATLPNRRIGRGCTIAWPISILRRRYMGVLSIMNNFYDKNNTMCLKW